MIDLAKPEPTSLAAMKRAERQRVSAIIARDQIDRQDEIFRKQAEMELAKGVFVNLDDTVTPPTPEWLAKFDTAPFTPRLHDGTVKTTRSVRRVVTPMVMRMWNAGKITDDQARACMWYRSMHDQAGLEGRWSSMRISDSPGGNQGGAAGHVPMSLQEAEARRNYRIATNSIKPHLRRFFQAVVIDDIIIRNAARFVRCSNGKEVMKFRLAANQLVVFVEGSGIDAAKASDFGGA